MTVTIEPHVEVYAVEETRGTSYGSAGKIAVIGAFPTATFKLDVFTRAEDAKAAMVEGTDYKVPGDNSVANASKTVVPDTYKAFYALDYYFARTNQSTGPEQVVIVNTNYSKSSLVQTSSNQDIADACVLLAEEDFDILSVAEPIPVATTVVVEEQDTIVLNPICATLKSFVNSQFLNQKPFGIITGFDLTDASTVLNDFKNTFNDVVGGMFKAVTTKVKLNGAATSLAIEQSGAWHAAYTAGRPVNKSETAKLYPGVIGENSKDVYPTTATISYSTLVGKGFHTTKYRNRRQQTIQCLNNITPKDYDMKIERVRNYIIKRLNLEDTLGEDNNQITKNGLIGAFEYEKQMAINAGYLVDMDYKITAITSEKVRADVKLYIADIIRVIELDVAVEIAAFMEE